MHSTFVDDIINPLPVRGHFGEYGWFGVALVNRSKRRHPNQHPIAKAAPHDQGTTTI
jgi:hypothetical protein